MIYVIRHRARQLQESATDFMSRVLKKVIKQKKKLEFHKLIGGSLDKFISTCCRNGSARTRTHTHAQDMTIAVGIMDSPRAG